MHASHRVADRVRTRLLAAFLILLLAAITLAVIGWMGMRSTQHALSGFEEEVLPGIAQALELAERTAQVAAIAPHLAESRSKETLDINTGVVQGLLTEIRQRSVDLPPGGGLRPVLDRLLEGVDRDLSSLIVLTQGKQLVHERLQQQLARLEQIGNRMHMLERRVGRVDPAIAGLWSSLVLGATTDTEAVLGRLEADVEALLIAARRRHAFAPFDKEFEGVLVDVATGPENILALRRSMREFERRTGYLVAITRTNADQLSDEVARHVAQLRSAAAYRSNAVARAVRSGETTMLVLALVCFLIALGATQYVRRLLGQIENITSVMSRLAQGDTSATTPATKRHDELGALARAFEVFRDNLLAKQQLVKALGMQRELLEAVHNSMTDGLAVFDHGYRLLLWNPQLAELLTTYAIPPREGVTLSELMRSFPAGTDWVAPGHTDPQPLPQARAGDFADFDHVELRLPDGQVYDLRTRAMPGGGTVTLTTDLTARRAIDTQLQHAQKLEVLGQLTGGVAHDFNNYLGTILGNLALLESQFDTNAASRAQLQRAQRAATRAAALTRRLLAFARRQPLSAEYVAVDDMIEEMQDLIEYSAGPQVKASFVLAARGACVYVDRGQLENALLNLVINSAAAMPAGGALTVRTRRSENGAPSVEIGVFDTGCGIPEHLQGRVFEPFFTTKSDGGSGLGLSIVYGFVKQSGGETALVSKQGAGTTVTLTFPAVAAPHQDTATSAAVVAQRPLLAPLRMLLVDDDDTFRTTVQEMLAASAASVVAVASGEAALQHLEADAAIDLVLSDVRLGSGMNGMTLVRAIRARTPQMRIALMSGVSPELFAHDSDWDASIPFLHKPFDAHTLIVWLDRLVRGPVAARLLQ